MIAQWITSNSDRPFYARQPITLSGDIVSATASVCGLGQFVFYVNGTKAGDHELDPGWTNYHKQIQYVDFDVTDMLRPGKNMLAAEVGNGWYIKQDEHYTFHFPPFMPPNPNPYQPFNDVLVLAMELKVTFADSSEHTFHTDTNCRVREHAVTMTNIYGSETMDGSRAVPGWNRPEYDDSDWAAAVPVTGNRIPSGTLVRQFQPPIKVIRTYEAVFLHEVNGRRIYDFGQNISGLLCFSVRGNAGDAISFYPAEKLDGQGDADQMAKNWLLIDNCITYRIGKTDVWEDYRMTFTYFSGRYMAVEGLISGEYLRALRADAITSAWQRDGSFTCDDERFNRIYDMTERTVEANMMSVHTDCPTIERFAWQEPNHLMAPSIMFMKRGDLLWKKFLQDMRAEQLSDEDWFHDMEGGRYYPGGGLMPAQAPCYIPNVLPVPGLGDFYDIIPWGSTCILGTYWHYQFYGDLSIVEENFDAGIRYLEHLKTKRTEDGFICHGLGDWGNPRNELARENVETAFLFADAKILAYFAGLLDRREMQAELTAFAESVAAGYNEKLLVYSETLQGYCYKAWDHRDELYMTQACEALPLYWGMVPEDKEADVVRALRYTLERDQSFICGEVGQPYVIQCASRWGMNDLVARFVLKPEHPSYYAFVLDGETTLGEYWEKNPRSHCHDMMGHIIEWYYRGIAGIRPLAPGFAEIEICPYLPASVHAVNCTYTSASGPIGVQITETKEAFLVHLDVAPAIAVHFDGSGLVGKPVIMV